MAPICHLKVLTILFSTSGCHLQHSPHCPWHQAVLSSIHHTVHGTKLSSTVFTTLFMASSCHLKYTPHWPWHQAVLSVIHHTVHGTTLSSIVITPLLSVLGCLQKNSTSMLTYTITLLSPQEETVSEEALPRSTSSSTLQVHLNWFYIFHHEGTKVRFPFSKGEHPEKSCFLLDIFTCLKVTSPPPQTPPTLFWTPVR